MTSKPGLGLLITLGLAKFRRITVTGIILKIQDYKNMFTAIETYKEWSSFGKNYSASEMKLKKK